MARRGIRIVFTLLSLAVIVSIAGVFALYLVLGVGEPSVPSGATLTLDVGGDLAEVAPTDVLSYVQGARRPTIQDIVDNLRKARVDDRIKGVLLKPTGFSTPYWARSRKSATPSCHFAPRASQSTRTSSTAPMRSTTSPAQPTGSS